MKNDMVDACKASGACNAISATTKNQEQRIELQAQQKRQLDAAIVTKRLEKLGALGATSRNKCIWFKAGKPHHNLQLICHIDAEKKADRNQLIDMKVFKLINRNATKRLRMRQEMRKMTKNGKIAEVTLKQIAG